MASSYKSLDWFTILPNGKMGNVTLLHNSKKSHHIPNHAPITRSPQPRNFRGLWHSKYSTTSLTRAYLGSMNPLLNLVTITNCKESTPVLQSVQGMPLLYTRHWRKVWLWSQRRDLVVFFCGNLVQNFIKQLDTKSLGDVFFFSRQKFPIFGVFFGSMEEQSSDWSCLCLETNDTQVIKVVRLLEVSSPNCETVMHMWILLWVNHRAGKLCTHYHP